MEFRYDLTQERSPRYGIFSRAWQIVARVVQQGAMTHPDDDWLRRPFEYHLARAQEHLRLWQERGDQQQDHVSHAAARLLMALTLREADDLCARH